MDVVDSMHDAVSEPGRTLGKLTSKIWPQIVMMMTEIISGGGKAKANYRISSRDLTSDTKMFPERGYQVHSSSRRALIGVTSSLPYSPPLRRLRNLPRFH